MCEAAEARWLSCSVLAARTGRSYEALRRALRKDAGAPQPRRGAGGRLEWPAEETLAWIARHRWHKPHDGVPAVCSVEGCSRPAIARGECGLHYARRAKGRPGDGEERRLGHPDGAGVYGVLDETEEGILCHECGRRLRSLGNHARLAHALTAAEYRDKHGLPRGRALIARDLREAISARFSTPEALARFADVRYTGPHQVDQGDRDAFSRSQRARYAGYGGECAPC